MTRQPHGWFCRSDVYLCTLKLATLIIGWHEQIDTSHVACAVRWVATCGHFKIHHVSGGRFRSLFDHFIEQLGVQRDSGRSQPKKSCCNVFKFLLRFIFCTLWWFRIPENRFTLHFCIHTSTYYKCLCIYVYNCIYNYIYSFKLCIQYTHMI